MDEAQAKQCKAEELFSHCVQLVRRIGSLKPAKEEFLVMKALLLVNVGKCSTAGRLHLLCAACVMANFIFDIVLPIYLFIYRHVTDIQLEDPYSVAKLREQLLNSLIDCVGSLRTFNCNQHVAQLLLCLPLLRQTDAAIRRYWTTIRREGKVAMNKLFVEMLESNVR